MSTSLDRAARGRGARATSARAGASGPDRAVPGGSRPARRLRARQRGHHRALRPPGRGLGRDRARGEHVIVTTSTASGKSLAFNLPVLDLLAREPKSRALYLYPTKALAQDQARALGGVPAEGGQAGDLRRRHRDRAALADQALGERDPDEPGHAPRRRPPAPRPLGRRAREPPLRRRRRGARLPRRLRLARRERAPPPAAAGPRLRLGAAVRAGVGDDREPGGARGVAARRCPRP